MTACQTKSNSDLDPQSETFHWFDCLGKTPQTSHYLTSSLLSSILLGWTPHHIALVKEQEQCAGQHHEASEPQIATLWRWIPNSPSRDSTLLAVNHTTRNKVKWHYLHNMGASSIFITGADSLFCLEGEAVRFLEMVINKYWGNHKDSYLSVCIVFKSWLGYDVFHKYNTITNPNTLEMV